MIQSDSKWAVNKKSRCYEEYTRTLIFTPETPDDEIDRVVAEEKKLWRQGFASYHPNADRCTVHLWACCDSGG